MNLAYAFLADYAETINNKLYVQGGLITRVAKPAFPIPLDLSLVLLLEQGRDETATTASLLVRIVDPEETDVVPGLAAQIGVGELSTGEKGQTPLTATLPIAVRLPIPIQMPGRYEVRATLDQGPEYVLPFDVYEGAIPAG